MSFRFSRFLLFAFLFWGVRSYGAIVGWIAVIELSEYQCRIGGYGEDGEPHYVASYSGNTARQELYVPGSTMPTMSSLGLTQYCDLAGSPAPQPPFTGPFNFWEVMNVRLYAVNDELANLSPLGDLNQQKPLSPVYGASSRSPYSFLLNGNSQYAGPNSSFGANGDLNIIQGRVSPDYPGVSPFYYYSPDGTLYMTDNPTSSMGTFDWNGSGYQYNPYSPSSSGSVDLSPVVSALQSEGTLTRDQLVHLLGSSGNSWVYDCKLSLSQLYSLASSQGLVTRPDVDFSGIYSRLDAIANKNLSVDTSFLAKDSTLSSVNANITSLRSDVSSLAKESTLQSAVSSLSSIDGKFSTLGLDIAAMKNILQGWDNTSVPVFPSSPDFGDDSPDDELPFDLSGFNDSVNQSLGTLVSWGDSGVPRVFDFDIVSHILSDVIGTIPSVGSDPVMFSVDFNLPYLGHVNKTFSFADYPFVGEFRSFLLWVIYVFFALACFKILHATII